MRNFDDLPESERARLRNERFISDLYYAEQLRCPTEETLDQYVARMKVRWASVAIALERTRL